VDIVRYPEIIDVSRGSSASGGRYLVEVAKNLNEMAYAAGRLYQCQGLEG
jgi:hypothetical protein